jgi:hypothetical protein
MSPMFLVRPGAWRTVCERDALADQARRQFIHAVEDPLGVVRRALFEPKQRTSALRTLAALPEERRRAALPELVVAASRYMTGIEQVRTAIGSLDREWLEENIGPEVWNVLGPAATPEEYLLLSVLLDDLGFDELLAELVRRALASDVPDIREAAVGLSERAPQPSASRRRRLPT